MVANRSQSLFRRLRLLLLVSVLFVALGGASTCGDSPAESSRRDCSPNDFSNFNAAQNRAACGDVAARNGCQNFDFNDLTDFCTGRQCTSCNR